MCSNDAFFRQDRDLESNELSQSRQPVSRWCVASLCMEIFDFHITQNDDSIRQRVSSVRSCLTELN